MQTFLSNPIFYFTINKTVTVSLSAAKEQRRLSKHHFGTKKRLSRLLVFAHAFPSIWKICSSFRLRTHTTPRIPPLLCAAMVLATQVWSQRLPHCIWNVHPLTGRWASQGLGWCPSQSSQHLTHSRHALNTGNVIHLSFWEKVFWQRHQHTIFSTMPVITFLIRGTTLKPFVGFSGILILYFSWQRTITTHLSEHYL